MENYIGRINKIGNNDPVNGQILNTVLEQIQHNIDLLYSSYNSSIQNWNVSEMIFGNMLNFDQTGEQRFINGGKLDALEKVLAFSSTVGTLSFEEYTTLNNSNWMRWDIAAGITNNVRLVRNITIPEQIRHQNILIAFKMVSYEGNTVLTNERYEIYVNGVFSGTAQTGIHEIGGIWEPKTLYGTYNLTGTETSISVELVRSVTNAATPSEYKVRVSNVFVGLHTLGNDSFSMNYPTSGSSFIGAGADINAFYDFENNSIRPIPEFLINGDRVEGTGSSLIINITTQDPAIQDTYYIGLSGTGNLLGVDAENLMPVDDFFAKESFNSSVVYVHVSQSDSYGTFNFDKGNFEVYISSDTNTLGIDNLTINTHSSVTLNIVPHDLGTTITIGEINVLDKSRLKTNVSLTNEVKLVNNEITVGDSSLLDMEIGMLNQPIISGGSLYLYDNSEVKITIADSDYINTDGDYGFGVSTGSIYANNYSTLAIDNLNNGYRMHIGKGRTQSIYLNNHSDYSSTGFTCLSTSADERKFKGKLHSGFEVFHDIQVGGSTGFTDVELLYYSTFGSVISAGTFTETLSSSLVYVI